LPCPQIAAVDAAGAHTDHDLRRTWNLVRKILVDKDLGRAMLPEERGLHCTLPASESAWRINIVVLSVLVVRLGRTDMVVAMEGTRRTAASAVIAEWKG
jgi:hypothetical protein